jgi:hypothetical protein
MDVVLLPIATPEPIVRQLNFWISQIAALEEGKEVIQ